MASDDALDVAIDVEWTYLDINGEKKTITVATHPGGGGDDARTPVGFGVIATEVLYGEAKADIAGTITVSTEENFVSGVPGAQNEVLAAITAIDNNSHTLAGRVPSDREYRIESLAITISREAGSNATAFIAFDTREPGGIFVNRRMYNITVPGIEIDPKIDLGPSTDYRVRIRDVGISTSRFSGFISFLQRAV
jgi:hypothetical protein